MSKSPSMSLGGVTQSVIMTLDEIGDKDLIAAVETVSKTNKVLEMENCVLEDYITRNDPHLLIGIQAILDKANKIQHNMQQAAMQSQMSMPESKSFGSVTSMQSKVSGSSRFGSSRYGSIDSRIRINLQTKIDLLIKTKEWLIAGMETYEKKNILKKGFLKAEIEEINLRILETKEARDIFETTIVKDSIDPITGRIPAEKLVRYMEEWLKSADSIIEKLRLRTSTLQYRFLYLLKQLKQKEMLGENLGEVDLNKLKIENGELLKEIEKKNHYLLDLKRKTGETNLGLSKSKNQLHKLMRRLSNSTTAIKQKKAKIIQLNRESKIVEKEVTDSRTKLEQIRYLIDNFTVPDLLDYIKKKQELYETKKNIKMWNRRINIQHIALASCIKKMKALTGRTTEDPLWFRGTITAKEEVDDESENESFY